MKKPLSTIHSLKSLLWSLVIFAIIFGSMLYFVISYRETNANIELFGKVIFYFFISLLILIYILYLVSKARERKIFAEFAQKYNFQKIVEEENVHIVGSLIKTLYKDHYAFDFGTNKKVDLLFGKKD